MTEPKAGKDYEPLPIADHLDAIGERQSILRHDGESDADYAERMIYELDVAVEELWAVQDSIRELISDMGDTE